MQIHQFVAGMSYGDAISVQAKTIQKIIRSWGYTSEIYTVSKHINPRVRKECKDFHLHKERSSENNLAILHFSTSSAVNSYFRSLPDRKILIYHNITPAKYLRVVNNRIAEELEAGRNELRTLASVPELSLADSDYNRRELVETGFNNTKVLPLGIDRKLFGGKPNTYTTSVYDQTHIKHFIFVGRMVPNKKFEDIILTFNYYNKFINSDSRLFMIGSYAGTEMYYNYLKSLTLQLGLKSAYLLGHVNYRDLLAYYRIADIFLCMSEHEGFCLPLIESMHFGIPIIAYKAAAVPETLGNAGILATRKCYPEIAEAAAFLLDNKTFRETILGNQKQRLKYFSIEQMAKRLRDYIGPWLNS